MKIFTTKAKWLLSFAITALLVTGIYSGCQNNDSASNPNQAHQTLNHGGLWSEADLSGAIAVQNRHTDELLAIDGVIGTGAGLHQDGTPAVYVFTNRPNVAGIPAALEGIHTRIENVGAVNAFAFTGTYRSPMYSGVSVGNDNECAAGTISCVVADPNNNLFLLSNNHVFARENAGKIGEKIDQQGRYDAIPQCGPSGQVGSLSRFVTISFRRNANNVVDCAIASIVGAPGATSQTPPGNQYTPTAATIASSVGMHVQKTGRTTGFTQAQVNAINVTLLVNYGEGRIARFINQIYIQGNFSAAGDSGSLIVEIGSNNPTALLFAGGTGSTFANPIGSVLSALGVSIVPN